MGELFSGSMDASLANRIALTLIHFLWQGMAIAALVWVVDTLWHSKSAQSRYLLNLGGMGAMVVCAVVTFGMLDSDTQRESVSPAADPRPVAHVADGERRSPATPTLQNATADVEPAPEANTRPVENHPQIDSRQISSLQAESLALTLPAVTDIWRQAAPLMTAAYLLGVVALLARLFLGLRGGWRLSRRSVPVDDSRMLNVLALRAQKLQMRAAPALCRCRDVVVPTVVGIVRPTILLPMSLASGWNVGQLEAILTHELAHIRRYDHLVNVFQRVVEAALFFHPAVWWISRRIRIEREHCCDDVVLALGAEPIGYAQLLVEIAENDHKSRAARGIELAAALQATAGQSQVSKRVKRILRVTANDNFRFSRGGFASSIAISAVLVFSALGFLATADDDAPEGERRTPPTARTDDDSAATPREVVAKFLRLIKHGPDREAWSLTAPDAHAGWGPEFIDLRQFESIRPLHQANSDKHALVVSNRFADNADRPRVFYARLIKHDAKWLIDRHSVASPDAAFRILEGFCIHPDARFDLIPAELAGRWRVNVCASSLSLNVAGKGSELLEGPGGPMPGAKPEPFTWEVSGNVLTKQFADRAEKFRIDWTDGEQLRLIKDGDDSKQVWDRVGAVLAVQAHAANVEEKAQGALHDDDHSNDDRRADHHHEVHEVAWGAPVAGIQAGLAFELDEKPYQLGQNIPILVRLRNKSAAPITYTRRRTPVWINWNNYRHPPGPTLIDKDGTRLLPYQRGVAGLGLPGKSQVTLGPGETVTVGRLILPVRSKRWPGGTTVNLLAYQTTPGEHLLSITDTFGVRLKGAEIEPLTTGELKLTLLPESKEVLPGEIGRGMIEKFGDLKHGIQVGVWTDKTVLVEGESPRLFTNVVNRAGADVQYDILFTCCVPEIDGERLSFSGDAGGPVPPPLSQGQELINVPISLERNWVTKRTFEPVRLKPGKHTVRVVFMAKQGGESISVASQPIEITVRAAKPKRGAAAGAKLKFLADVPEFHQLNLTMSEEQLKHIVARHKLVVRTTADKKTVSYTLYNAVGACVIVMFRDGHCAGIQRMRADPSLGERKRRLVPGKGAALRRDDSKAEIADAADSKAGGLSILTELLTQSDDPLEQALRIDNQKIAADAKKSQQDYELVARVCNKLGLTDDDRTAIVDLARRGRLSALNFATMDRVASHAPVYPTVAKGEKYQQQMRKAKTSFAKMVGFTLPERAAFEGMMQRTGQRTMTICRFDADDNLSDTELASADKFRKFAAEWFVNHQAAQKLTNAAGFNNAEVKALKQLSASINERFEKMYLVLYSC